MKTSSDQNTTKNNVSRPKKPVKTKLIWGTITWILSLIALGLAIYFLMHRSGIKELDSEDVIACAIISLVAGFLLMVLTHYLAKSYRKRGNHAWSLVLYITTFLQFWLAAGIVVVGYKICKSIMNGDWDDGKKRVTAKDRDGKEHQLTQEFQGGSSYKDEQGQCWTTSDGGKTFRKE